MQQIESNIDEWISTGTKMKLPFGLTITAKFTMVTCSCLIHLESTQGQKMWIFLVCCSVSFTITEGESFNTFNLLVWDLI